MTSAHDREATQPGERLFCSKPFDWFEAGPGGTAFACCPSWLPKPIGDLRRQTPEQVWNGPAAQQIRRSILDGSFRHCTALCPHLATVTGPVVRVRDVEDPEHRRILDEQRTVVDRPPRTLNCSYDRSCNLACPTCRSETIVATGQERERLQALQDRLLEAFLPGLDMLYVTGSGDPFGSPLFDKMLRELDAAQRPDLRVRLHTNAQLFTRARWERIARIQPAVRQVEVSIDAATPATYAINRRPGSWKKLCENMELISELRRDGPIEWLGISFVVQQNNWREMPAFVELGRAWGVDLVYFGQVANWSFPRRFIGSRSVFSPAAFARIAVHEPRHPEHAAFCAMLTHERFDAPFVELGNLEPLRRVAPAAAGVGRSAGEAADDAMADAAAED